MMTTVLITPPSLSTANEQYADAMTLFTNNEMLNCCSPKTLPTTSSYGRGNDLEASKYCRIHNLKVLFGIRPVMLGLYKLLLADHSVILKMVEQI